MCRNLCRPGVAHSSWHRNRRFLNALRRQCRAVCHRDARHGTGPTALSARVPLGRPGPLLCKVGQTHSMSDGEATRRSRKYWEPQVPADALGHVTKARKIIQQI